MKKVISLVAAGTFVLAVFFFSRDFTEFKELDRKHLNLRKGLEERITLINIGEGNREYLALLINKIVQLEPAALGIDVFFSQFNKDASDTLLRNAIAQQPIVIGAKHRNIGLHGTHPFF